MQSASEKAGFEEFVSPDHDSILKAAQMAEAWTQTMEDMPDYLRGLADEEERREVGPGSFAERAVGRRRLDDAAAAKARRQELLAKKPMEPDPFALNVIQRRLDSAEAISEPEPELEERLADWEDGDDDMWSEDFEVPPNDEREHTTPLATAGGASAMLYIEGRPVHVCGASRRGIRSLDHPSLRCCSRQRIPASMADHPSSIPQIGQREVPARPLNGQGKNVNMSAAANSGGKCQGPNWEYYPASHDSSEIKQVAVIDHEYEVLIIRTEKDLGGRTPPRSMNASRTPI
eukprot:gnl/TRDRNA2_/TRDRNA2_40437_c0_seq1.p1 gnl/TRDRNA2_/TRDRNA2_40437_c0~~gnl/TRDRNA2_/TRDRNA2_40437_c0_seq1.p1  ORF type:complete len:289 (-),score=56.15 gnl/TRDRNA2_/TRDRNA2_40437_c0_seq1:95-961(-)